MNKREFLQEFEQHFLNKKRTLKPIFYKNKPTKVYKDHLHLIQQLINFTILLPHNATYPERYYALKHDIIFRPRCMECGLTEVSFDHNISKYKQFCSGSCGNRHRAKYITIADDLRLKLSKRSKHSNYKRNVKKLETNWKPFILSKHQQLDFSKFDWQPYKSHSSIVICDKHGEQEVKISYLLESKYGCPECGRSAKGVEYGQKKLERKKKEFFEWLKKNKPYAITENTFKQYVDFGTKIEFNCPTHGIFYATPFYMQRTQYNCPKCGKYIGSKKSPISEGNIKQFIKNKFPHFRIKYLEYNHIKNKNIILECPEHGDFVTSLEILKCTNYCCPKCAKEVFSNKRAYTKDEAIEVLKLKHHYLDFSKFEYKRSYTNSMVVCPVHGNIFVSFNYLISSDYGCPKCGKGIKRSKNEIKIQEYIESLGVVDVIPSHLIKNDKRNIELDIFIPSHNFAIEYNGIYWHSMQSGRGKGYHSHKTNVCRENNIFLFHVFEDQWEDNIKQDIIKSMIKSKLGLIKNKVYARKCEIVEITDSKIKNKFYDENHIQGRCNSNYDIALKYDDEVVSVMSISYDKKRDEWDLIRFANKKYTSVIGGFSKLLKHFEKAKNPKRIITFADLMYSYGDVYLKNGFKKEYEIEEGYFYYYNGKRYHRSSFMKNKIKERFNLSDEYIKSKTETELVEKFNILRIYDCGKIKFSKTL